MSEFLLILILFVGGPKTSTVTIHTRVPVKCEVGAIENVILSEYRVAMQLSCEDKGFGPHWIVRRRGGIHDPKDGISRESGVDGADR